MSQLEKLASKRGNGCGSSDGHLGGYAGTLIVSQIKEQERNETRPTMSGISVLWKCFCRLMFWVFEK